VVISITNCYIRFTLLTLLDSRFLWRITAVGITWPWLDL